MSIFNFYVHQTYQCFLQYINFYVHQTYQFPFFTFFILVYCSIFRLVYLWKWMSFDTKTYQRCSVWNGWAYGIELISEI